MRKQALVIALLSISLCLLQSDLPARAQSGDDDGSARGRQSRAFNPFSIKSSRRFTPSRFGFPRINRFERSVKSVASSEAASETQQSTEAAESDESLITVEMSASSRLAAGSSGRPVYRPPVRSPYRPPPRPPF